MIHTRLELNAWGEPRCFQGSSINYVAPTPYPDKGEYDLVWTNSFTRDHVCVQEYLYSSPEYPTLWMNKLTSTLKLKAHQTITKHRFIVNHVKDITHVSINHNETHYIKIV